MSLLESSFSAAAAVPPVSTAMYGSLPTAPPSKASSAVTTSTLFSWARLAGCLYIVIIVCGITSEVALRGALLDDSDDSVTYANLLAMPGKLRGSLLLDVVMSVSDILVSVLLAAVLYHAGADVLLTAMTTVFRLLQQAVLMANLIHLVVVLLLVDPLLASYDLLQPIMGNDSSTQSALALLFLHVHTYGYALAMIFFGVGLLALGAVLYMSRIYPRWLAVTLGLAGTGYLLDSLCYFVVANYNGDTVLSQIFMLPVLVGEIGLAVTLLVRPPSVVVAM